MSDHDTRSNTSEEESDRRSAKLTGLAIGGGSSPDRLVGMSSPPPYPPHGKEAVGRDSVPTAVSGATCPQSRGSSAAPAATEQNMSSPPDIERPPFTGIGCSTGQGKQTHSQYGAWPSSTGAQRGAQSSSTEAPPRDQRGAQSSSTEAPPRDQRGAQAQALPGRPEASPRSQHKIVPTLSEGRQYTGMQSVFSGSRESPSQQGLRKPASLSTVAPEIPLCRQRDPAQGSSGESEVRFNYQRHGQVLEHEASDSPPSNLARRREESAATAQYAQQHCSQEDLNRTLQQPRANLSYNEEYDSERSSGHDGQHERDREYYDTEVNGPNALDILAAVAGEVQRVEERLGQHVDQRLMMFATVVQETVQEIQNNMQQSLAQIQVSTTGSARVVPDELCSEVRERKEAGADSVTPVQPQKVKSVTHAAVVAQERAMERGAAHQLIKAAEPREQPVENERDRSKIQSRSEGRTRQQQDLQDTGGSRKPRCHSHRSSSSSPERREERPKARQLRPQQFDLHGNRVAPVASRAMLPERGVSRRDGDKRRIKEQKYQEYSETEYEDFSPQRKTDPVKPAKYKEDATKTSKVNGARGTGTTKARNQPAEVSPTRLLETVNQQVGQQLQKFANEMQSTMQDSVYKTLGPLMERLSIVTEDQPQRRSDGSDDSLERGRKRRSARSSTSPKGTGATRPARELEKELRRSSDTDDRERDRSRDGPSQSVLRQAVRPAAVVRRRSKYPSSSPSSSPDDRKKNRSGSEYRGKSRYGREDKEVKRRQRSWSKERETDEDSGKSRRRRGDRSQERPGRRYEDGSRKSRSTSRSRERNRISSSSHDAKREDSDRDSRRRRGKGNGGSSSPDSSGDDRKRKRDRKKGRSKSEGRRKRRSRTPLRSSSVRAPRSQAMKAPKFDGKTPLDEFIIAFENCARFNGWSKYDKAAYLRNSLTGNASQLLRDAAKDTYSELVGKLERRYGTKGQQERFRAEIRCRRRKKDESVAELAEAIRGLMTLAYPGDQTASTNAVIARDAFLTALNDPELEEKIRSREPEDLDEACRIALRQEVIRNAIYTGTAGNKGHQVRQAADEADFDSAKTTSPGSSSNKRRWDWKKEKSQPQAEAKAARATEANRGNPAEPSELLENLLKRVVEEQKLRVEAETKAQSLQKEMERRNCVDAARQLVPKAMTPGTEKAELPPPPRPQQRQFRWNENRGQCFNCGADDHWRRDCPHPPKQRRSSDNPQPGRRDNQDGNEKPPEGRQVQSNRAFAANSRGSASGYLEVKVDGRSVQCLVDTGSETSVFPFKVIRPEWLRPTRHTLRAANGTMIPVKGEADIPISLPGLRSTVKAVISEYISEPMLGYDWMRDVGALLDCARQRLILDGHEHRLRSRPAGNWVRRVVVQEDICIPDHCEYDVSTRVELRRREQGIVDCSPLWMSETKAVRDGVHVPRTLITDRLQDVPIRVLNVSGEPVHFMVGQPLAELYPVIEVLGAVTSEEQDGSYEPVIREMVSGVDSSVGENTRRELVHLLREFTPILSKGETDMGLTDLVMHKIDTADAEPTRQVLRRQSKPASEAIDQMVPELLRAGLIEPSVSPWAANVVVVRKKDGSARCCIDYRQLNAVTKKDRYPLPRTDSCLDSMNGSKWFSTFDLRSAYHQVPINPPDREKTSFICHRGSFQYRTMPFGLCNAGATFQRLMDVVLNGLSLQICLAYLDDVIVFSRDLDEHLLRLRRVFERLQNAGLKVKPSKCKILQRQVSFLGHVIDSDGISTDPEKIRAVTDWPTPNSVRDVRAFIGLASYYRRFVQDFAAIAAPLHQLMRKNARFQWNSEHHEAFERLKRALVEAPVLVTPNEDPQYILDADASDTAMGAVLSVVIDEEEHVVAYASRAFSKCQRNYCVTRRELLAVVLALKVFKQYLLGRHFVVRTDHSALQWFKKSKEPVGQPGRWLETMEEYQFDIQFRAGTKHANADALSRRPCPKQNCYCHDFENEEMMLNRSVRLNASCRLSEVFDVGLSKEEVITQQKQDPELRVLYEALEKEEVRPTWEEVALQTGKTKVLWGQWPRLKLKDKVMCRRWEAAVGDEIRWQVVMPGTLRKAFVKQVHGGITGGHLGRDKTEEQVVRRAYWPGWKQDVAQALRECAQCTQYHRGLPPRQVQLKPLVAGSPWERMSIDVTGPHPPSAKGHRFILTLVDHFSKWAEAFAIRRHTAPVIAKILVTQVFARFGCPDQILSDQGPEFEGALMSELCQELHVDKTRTSPYKASTNGAVERFHRTLNAMLGKVVSEKQRDWDEWLPLVMMAYRASPHTATGFTPNMLTFGREVSMPVDIVLGKPEEDNQELQSNESYVGSLLNRLEAAYTLVREQLQAAAKRRKKQYDLRVREKDFKVGTWVWYYCPRRYQKRSPKWQRMYSGPFLVMKRISPWNYVIQRSKHSLPKVVHADKLRGWLGEPPPSWLPDVEPVDPPVAAPKAQEIQKQPKGKVKEVEPPERASDSEGSPEGSEGEVVTPRARPTRAKKQPARFRGYVM